MGDGSGTDPVVDGVVCDPWGVDVGLGTAIGAAPADGEVGVGSVTMGATGPDGVGGWAGEGEVGGVDVGPEIVTVALADSGFNWLVITNWPEAGDEPPVGIPSHVAVRVNDCPGGRVFNRMNIGFAPALERQTDVPSWVTVNPSMLGPSPTEIVRLDSFVSWNVISIGWPGW
jgi:hypothetical protein